MDIDYSLIWTGIGIPFPPAAPVGLPNNQPQHSALLADGATATFPPPAPGIINPVMGGGGIPPMGGGDSQQSQVAAANAEVKTG